MGSRLGPKLANIFKTKESCFFYHRFRSNIQKLCQDREMMHEHPRVHISTASHLGVTGKFPSSHLIGFHKSSNVFTFINIKMKINPKVGGGDTHGNTDTLLKQ